MPFTFLSHQAVVLPLELASPRRVSGTALVLGSIAPDVEYIARTYPTGGFGHSWTGQLLFCLPVTLALYGLVTRLVAPAAAAHLPASGPFAWRDYALIGAGRRGARAWLTVALSALIGSVSHVLLDRVERAAERGLAGALAIEGGSAEVYVSATTAVVQVGGSLLLAIGALVMLHRIGLDRLIRRAASGRGVDVDAVLAEVEALRIDPRIFWLVVAGATAGGGALAFVTRRPGFFADDVATWAHVWLAAVASGFVGLVVASVWARARGRGGVR